MLSKLTIRQKNWLLAGLAGLIAIVMTYAAFALTVDAVSHERRLMSQRMSEMALGVIKDKYALFEKGVYTEKEAKADAIKTLRPMRYGSSGYFFLYQLDGTALMMPPKPEYEGVNRMHITDPNGVKVIEELARVAANGEGGFVRYHKQRPNSDAKIPKVSYSIGFEPWDWFVGTGDYEADLQETVVMLIKRKLILSLVVVLVFVALLVIISMINRATLRQVLTIKKHLEDFARGNFNEKIRVENQDEFGEMTKSMKTLQSKMDKTLSQMGTTIEQARRGNLNERVPLEDKEGFFLSLSNDVNQLIEISRNVVNDTERVFAALAKGDLSQRIETPYQGAFDKLKRDANATIEELRTIINVDIQGLVDSASQGDLTTRISMQGKSGFFKSLSEGVNSLVGSIDALHQDLASTLYSMANGDLTQPITRDYEGSFQSLKEDTNKTLGHMTRVVRELLDLSDFIARGSNEITEGNTNLAQRTEAQANALETTASSVEEINSTIKHNSDNTYQATNLATTARTAADNGRDVMNRAISAMNDINIASGKIAEIIAVIDEIAFQTNLLALNAAVEAARAGEEGRGFAVVAGEVRNLAGRSAAAAKEIKELIEDSVQKVNLGTQLVDETGMNLIEIQERIVEVEGVIEEISSAGREQTLGISQVTEAINNLDAVTQQNAALAQQTSVASSSLTDSSNEMRQLVTFFSVPEKEFSAA